MSLYLRIEGKDRDELEDAVSEDLLGLFRLREPEPGWFSLGWETGDEDEMLSFLSEHYQDLLDLLENLTCRLEIHVSCANESCCLSGGLMGLVIGLGGCIQVSA